MSQRVVIGVACALALAAGGWWLLGDDEAPRVAPHEEATAVEERAARDGGPLMDLTMLEHRLVPGTGSMPAAQPTELDVPAPPAADDEPDAALTSFEPVPGARVSGHVLTVDGAALPEARVLLRRGAEYRDGGWQERTEPVGTTLSDRNGAFVVDAFPDGKVELAAELEGWVCVQRVEGEVARFEEVDGAELLMAPALHVSGTVRDARGAPVEAVELTLSEPPNRPHLVTSKSGEVLQAPDVVLAPTLSHTRSARSTARSDASGSFVFPALAAGPAALSAKHAEYPTLMRPVSIDGSALDVVLDDGATLTGIVYDSEGEPLPGVEVRLRGARVFENDIEPRDAITDADGAFVLRGLTPSESAYVLLRAKGHAVHVVQPQPIAADRPTVVEYDLLAESTISGVIRDRDGAPLEGFGVKAQGDRIIDLSARFHPIPTWEQRAGVSSTESDAEGRFRLGQLYAGTFQLGIYRDGALLHTISVESGGDEVEVEIDVASLGSVAFRGRVIDSFTGLPVPHFKIFVWRPNFSGGFSGSPRTFEDVEGRYAIEGLNPGILSLSATADGYHDDKTPRLEYDAGEHVVDLSVAPHRELRLRLIRPSGEPVPGASIAFHDVNGQQLWLPTGGGGRSSAMSTDMQGELHAFELPAGRVSLSITETFGNEAQTEEFDLTRPLDGVQTIILDEELTSRPTERGVNVMLLALAEDRPADLITTNTAEITAMQASLMAQFTSGKLGFVARDVALTFVSAAGDEETHASYGRNEDGEWVLTAEMSWSTFNRPGFLSWDVPVGEGTLTLDIEGKGVRTIALPDGDEELHAMLWFAEP